MPTILVYWSEGRSREQKARVIDGIIEVMVEQGGARPEDVVVIFQDIEPGNSGRGARMPVESDHADTSSSA